MSDNEKAIMQAMEKALRTTAEKHAEKAQAATDEDVKRVELNRYNMHIFAAVTVHKLIKQLDDYERHGHT